ncbi:MAG: PilN domain-containing protein [Prosthecobacter sp.]|jgi:hypothetical protein|nr:PilN domain-containing protein [Prosthecobacter sp.]
MSIAASTLLLPAPDATWRLWKPKTAGPEATVETPTDVQVKKGKPLVVGLPATACRTIGMILPNADHDVLEQIIITQLERRGLKPVGGAERNFRWHLITQTAATATVSVDILAEPFPEGLALTQASDYTAALRLVSLPAQSLVVVEEQGCLVLAAGSHGRLYHSHILAPAATMALEEMAQELELARMALEAELGEGACQAIVLVGSAWEPALVKSLENLTGMPVRQVTQLPPHPSLDTHGWPRLLPASVRQAQQDALRRSRLIRASVLGGLLALSLAFLAYAYLRYQENEAARLQADVEKTAGPAQSVRQTADMWKALSPAIEPRRYPMFLLAEVTKLMPPSGLVIRRFHLKDNTIDIRGEARDAQTAVQFMEDLQKHPVLSRYQWSKPSPNVKGSTAEFRTEGKALP